MEHHGSSSACPTFKFRVIGSFKDPLRRQLLEAIKITYSGTLNKRNEYGHMRYVGSEGGGTNG